jgi:cell division protein FtsL
MPRAATAAARTATARPQRAPRKAQVRPVRRRSGPGRPAAAAGARVLPLPQRLELPALGPAAAGLLDRLLRGRIWVFLIGTLLVGIVFFNVDVLRLNRTIATTTQKASALKQENARLVLLQAKLGSTERIQSEAARNGMVLPAPGDVRYLKSNVAGDSRRAARQMTAPAPVPAPAAIPQTQQTPGTAPPPSPATPQTTSTTPTTTTTTPQSTTTTPQTTASPTPSTPDPTPGTGTTTQTGGATAGGASP